MCYTEIKLREDMVNPNKIQQESDDRMMKKNAKMIFSTIILICMFIMAGSVAVFASTEEAAGADDINAASDSNGISVPANEVAEEFNPDAVVTEPIADVVQDEQTEDENDGTSVT